MTMRERMLAVVRGEEHDRVPFVQYSGTGAPDGEAWALVGRENMGLLRWSHIAQWDHPHCRFESEEMLLDGRPGVRTTLYTPAGTLTSERRYQETYGVAAAYKHYVRAPEDYRVLLAYFQDLQVRGNHEALRAADAELGEDGFCHVSVPRTPYQQLWIEWVSLEDLALHLVDCPELVEACMAEMAARLRLAFALVREAPIPYIVIPDNITAPAIGERYFRKYALPLYQELAGIAAEKGIPMYAHLDGDLKPLWSAIGESGLRGIDSFSPPPDNDTSVAEARSLWPEMRLGVNFPSSVHLAAPEAIYAQARQILEQGGGSGRVQIQISENVPPGVWRTSYTEIVRAVRDWGRP